MAVRPSSVWLVRHGTEGGTADLVNSNEEEEKEHNVPPEFILFLCPPKVLLRSSFSAITNVRVRPSVRPGRLLARPRLIKDWIPGRASVPHLQISDSD